MLIHKRPTVIIAFHIVVLLLMVIISGVASAGFLEEMILLIAELI